MTILQGSNSFGPAKQRGLDYSQLPATGREADPSLSPAQYAEQLEQMNKAAEFMAYSGTVVECSKGLHRPGKAVFACDHCITQDPVHPVGIITTPFKYFLCMDCYHRHIFRKLDLAHKLKVYCNQCIIDEWERIKKIDPTKVRDFLKRGVY